MRDVFLFLSRSYRKYALLATHGELNTNVVVQGLFRKENRRADKNQRPRYASPARLDKHVQAPRWSVRHHKGVQKAAIIFKRSVTENLAASSRNAPAKHQNIRDVRKSIDKIRQKKRKKRVNQVHRSNARLLIIAGRPSASRARYAWNNARSTNQTCMYNMYMWREVDARISKRETRVPTNYLRSRPHSGSHDAAT